MIGCNIIEFDLDYHTSLGWLHWSFIDLFWDYETGVKQPGGSLMSILPVMDDHQVYPGEPLNLSLRPTRWKDQHELILRIWWLLPHYDIRHNSAYQQIKGDVQRISLFCTVRCGKGIVKAIIWLRQTEGCLQRQLMMAWGGIVWDGDEVRTGLFGETKGQRLSFEQNFKMDDKVLKHRSCELKRTNGTICGEAKFNFNNQNGSHINDSRMSETQVRAMAFHLMKYM